MQIDSRHLDATYAETLELIKRAAIEPMKLLELAEKFNAARRYSDVAQLYQTWLSHCSSPVNYVIQFNLGVTLSQIDQFPAAEKAYRDAINLKPDLPQAWFNLGSVIERQHRPENALTIWQSMLDHPLVGPQQNKDLYLMVLNSMGRLMEEIRQFDEAEAKLFASLQADPAQPKVIQHWVHLRQKQCKWPALAEVPNLSHGDMLKATSPLAMLAESADSGLQLATSMRFVKERVDQRVPALAPADGYKHEKIRIGFLSSDFCLHAVSLLTVELLELLDRDRFEVYGFCWSREDGSELRARVLKSFDQYIRIAGMDDTAAAGSIRQHEIDILVDMQGLTSGARPNILAFRPAPVQMTYLGFPGTTGLPFIDYVIADKYLIPDSEKPFYSETPLYLPQVYQCSDRKRPIAQLPTRKACGLPEDKFVFCSFNNNYKFTQEVFTCWLRMLRRVPESVLWLLADNSWAQASMVAAAGQHGIDSDRLIFAPRVAPPEYLARYTAADLFLDTYPFNAGTTANDALWMGLPVLTRSGRPFASRMAGALLTSLDLPELITTNIEDYEECAVQLATHPKQYAKLKRRLENERKSSHLFDMPSFVRGFEEAVSATVIKQG